MSSSYSATLVAATPEHRAETTRGTPAMLAAEYHPALGASAIVATSHRSRARTTSGSLSTSFTPHATRQRIGSGAGWRLRRSGQALNLRSFRLCLITARDASIEAPIRRTLVCMPIVAVTGSPRAARTHLLLHGAPGDRTDLDLVGALAPPGARLAWHELPDHGAQPDQPDVALDLCEDDVAEAVRDLGGEVVLVGYSFSAYLAARVLPRVAQQVVRLVCIAGFPYMEPEQVKLRLELADALRAGAMDAQRLKPVLRELFLGAHAVDAADTASARVDRAVDETPIPRLLRIVARIAQVAESSRQVAAFTTPAVVLHGARERSVPPHLGRALAALGTNARFVELATDSHALPWTHPASVAAHAFAWP